MPDAPTRRSISRVAGARGHVWRLLADLWAPPTAESVARLRSGELAGELRDATAWLGPDADRFLAPFAALEAFARRARRVPAEEDLDRLRAEHRRLGLDDPTLVVAMRGMADRCDDEAEAWARGQERARSLRAEQHRVLESVLMDELPARCAVVDERAEVMVYRAIARVAVSVLSVESGRDFDRTVFPRPL